MCTFQTSPEPARDQSTLPLPRTERSKQKYSRNKKLRAKSKFVRRETNSVTQETRDTPGWKFPRIKRFHLSSRRHLLSRGLRETGTKWNGRNVDDESAGWGWGRGEMAHNLGIREPSRIVRRLCKVNICGPYGAFPAALAHGQNALGGKGVPPSVIGNLAQLTRRGDVRCLLLAQQFSSASSLLFLACRCKPRRVNLSRAYCKRPAFLRVCNAVFRVRVCSLRFRAGGSVGVE